MTSPRTSLKRPADSSLICLVCGDVARGMNFDVLTCMSCKAFFRRNALRPTKLLQCQMANQCSIDQQTRSACTACRLKKCFDLGMKSDLIRSPYQSKSKRQKRPTLSLPRPQPLSLLNNDRSTLSLDEWNLLSNAIHAYDEQNLCIRTQHLFQQQSSFPPKIRTKTCHTLEIISSFYTAIQPLIERAPHFHHLPSDQRRLLTQNNLSGVGAFCTMVAAAEARVFENELHIATCNEIYGREYVAESHRLLKRFDANLTLVKLMLLVSAFATNSSIVIYDDSYDRTVSEHTKSLFQIQNIFATMMWKYLTYQYGHVEAVKRFANLVKNYLDTLKHLNANHSQQHQHMVDDVVGKMNDALIFQPKRFSFE